MRIGTVTGSVWATRKAACLQGQTFLVVQSGLEEIVATMTRITAASVFSRSELLVLILCITPTDNCDGSKGEESSSTLSERSPPSVAR